MTRRVQQPYAAGRGPKRVSVQVRLWRRVLLSPGCWLWQGPVDKDGYGVIADYSPPKGRKLRTHVVAFVAAYGPVPAGLNVLHTCDVANCCRPTHLYAGTAQQNMDDRSNRGRWAGGRPRVCDHGTYVNGKYRQCLDCRRAYRRRKS